MRFIQGKFSRIYWKLGNLKRDFLKFCDGKLRKLNVQEMLEIYVPGNLK